MMTTQTTVRKEDLCYGDLRLGKEFSENSFGIMLTKQTNVRKEVLFQVDF